MDSDAGYLSGAALLILLLLFDFIMTAFASALHHISDTELQPAFSEQEKPPDEISALREQSARLKHTCRRCWDAKMPYTGLRAVIVWRGGFLRFYRRLPL